MVSQKLKSSTTTLSINSLKTVALDRKVVNILGLAFMGSVMLSGCSSSSSETDDGGTETDNTLVWTDESAANNMPSGVKFMVGSVSGNGTLYYLELDLNQENVALRAVKSETSQSIGHYVATDGVVAAVNGGYFSGNSSYSAVVDDGVYYARNVTSLNRGGQSYPVLRSGFTLSDEGQADVHWIYQFDTSNEVYVYNEPLAYGASDPTPLPQPTKDDGQLTTPKLVIGGGPTLVKNGAENLTYDQEIFWGSGVEVGDYRPRTAVCATADDKVIMLVAKNFKLSLLPELMIDLGCEAAMNLDGGGSTAMALNGNTVYDQGRAVPTALMIVDTSVYSGQ